MLPFSLFLLSGELAFLFVVVVVAVAVMIASSRPRRCFSGCRASVRLLLVKLFQIGPHGAGKSSVSFFSTFLSFGLLLLFLVLSVFVA